MKQGSQKYDKKIIPGRKYVTLPFRSVEVTEPPTAVLSVYFRGRRLELPNVFFITGFPWPGIPNLISP